MAATARQNVLRTMANVTRQACPMHGAGCSGGHSHADVMGAAKAIQSGGRHRSLATTQAPETEYAFEVSAAQLRFGEDVTKEVGLDFKNWGAKRVAVFSDPTVSKLRPLKRAIESLEAAGVPYDVFTDCRVEPNQESWTRAIDWTRRVKPDFFLATGGGSVIDTAKVANLY